MQLGKGNTCCFTGHRPSKLPWKTDEKDERCIKLKNTLYDVAESLYFSGIRHYIIGMAQGCDMYFCEQVLKLRKSFSDVTVEAAIPCESQPNNWPEAEKQRYFYLLSQCDERHFVSKEYKRGCMARRNKYMVEKSSVLVAVYDGALGGTLQTINFAKKNSLEVIIVAP